MLPCLRGPVPFVLAHRGFDLEGLENTMRAFEAAVRLGVDFVETDVRATSDGVPLAFHDARLDRLTGVQGRVGDLPWSRVRRALVGGREPIALLEDVLSAWPDVRVNVDVKERAAVAPFVQAVRRTGARERVCVASFSDRRRAAAVAELRRDGPVAWSPGAGRLLALAAVARTEVSTAPGRAVGGAVGGAAGGAVGGAVGRAVGRALGGAACVQAPADLAGRPLVTGRFVRAVHAHQVQVHAWTVDDPVRMRELIALGVDGLVTNRADLALALVRGHDGGALS